MRRPLLIAGLVTVMVPFLLNGATATGAHPPKHLKLISGTVAVDMQRTSAAGAPAQPSAPAPQALTPTTTSGGCADHWLPTSARTRSARTRVPPASSVGLNHRTRPRSR